MARTRTLELEQHLPFLRREWVVQAIGLWLLAAFVVLAAGGVFGSGPASRAVISAPDLELQFDRFVRASRASELRVTLAPDEPGSATAWVSQAYLAEVELVGMDPEPVSTHTAGGRTGFRFEATSPLRVIFRIVPRHAGRLSGEIGRGGSAGHAFRQFVYF